MIAFVDIETTGLKVSLDQILEICIVAISDDLESVRQAVTLVMELEDHRRRGVIPIDPFVQEMHTKSGLFDDCLGPQAYFSFSTAEVALMDWMDAAFGDEKPIMAGFGVGNFDRQFIERSWPRLHERFHYRSLDLRSMTEAIKRWASPDVIAGLPKGREIHRAYPDCLDAIEAAKYIKGILGSVS